MKKNNKLNVAIDTDHLKISLRPGQGRRCIVCCASVGSAPTRIGGIDGQREEYVSTLGERCEHQIFLIDKLRSWYSEPDIVSVMTDFVLEYVRSNSVSGISMLGGSMGGAGALILGEILGADRVLAFNPQSSVSDKLGFEDRYENFKVNFKSGYDFADCCRSESMKNRAVIITGDYQDNDVLHGQRFYEHGFHPVIMKNCGHNSPKKLRSLGILKSVVNEVMDGRKNEALDLVGRETAIVRGDKALHSFLRAHALYIESKRKREDAFVASSLARSAVCKEPTVGKFHSQLGNLLMEIEKWSGAEMSFKRALELDAQRSVYHVSLSRVLMMQGRSEEAFFHGRAAMRFADETEVKVSSLENYAWLLLKCGDPAEAEKFQVKALTAKPNDPAVRIRYAEIIKKRGRIGAAAAEVLRAVKLKGDDPDYYNFYGSLLLEMNDVSGAEQAVRTALSMNPEKSLYYALLSRIHHRSGRILESVEAIDRAIQLDEKKPNYYNHLGNLLMIAGDVNGAVKSHRIAASLAPDEPVFAAQLQAVERAAASYISHSRQLAADGAVTSAAASG